MRRALSLMAGVFALVFTASVPAAAQNATEHDPENVLVLELSTGTVEILMRPDLAPNHVERIKTLTRDGFYDGIIFHRVIDGFMAQAGDPTGTGAGGSDLPDLEAEFTDTPFRRGIVGMARTADPDTANSQFFIMFNMNRGMNNPRSAQTYYTVWGEVIDGMGVVDALPRGEPPAEPGKIISAHIKADMQNGGSE